MTLEREFDVVVVGGGTAGAAAGISSARQGARTLIVEQLGSLGGTQAHAWVTPMMANHLDSFKLSRGLNLEIVARQSELQPPGFLQHGDEWYDPTMLAMVLDDLAVEAGVTCLFNATLARVSGKPKVDWIDVITRGGILRLHARAFIDCSGDADLCYMAGAETMGGDGDGVHQPMTLRFTMGGIDMIAARQSLAPFLRLNTPDYVEAGYGEAIDSPMAGLVERAIQMGVLEPGDLGYFQLFSINGRPGELAFNAPRISGLDPLDPFEMSTAYQVGRKKIYRISNFMKVSFSGFEHSYVSVVAPLMGIRESRRVVGEYVLTADDHLSCRKFSDVVARNRYPIDIHLKKGLDYRKFPPGEWHDIPYECIVVKEFENLWVAGRCLSADFVAQSAVRIQPVCRALGEAAGVAASWAARNGKTAQQVPYEVLAERLDLSVK